MKCTKKFSTEEIKKDLFGYESANKPYVLAIHKTNRIEAFFKIETERNLKLEDSFVFDGEEYVIISIPPFSFENIAGIQSISLPNSIETIGEGAFILCKDLDTISLGSNLKEIGNYAFCGTKLSNINVQQDNLFFSDRNGVLLDKQKSKIIFYPPYKSMKDLEIWDSISLIGSYAFACNREIETLKIESNSITIGDYAFSGCERLREISLLSNECLLGKRVFGNCNAIESIKIDAPLPSLEHPVFEPEVEKSVVLYIKNINESQEKKYWRNISNVKQLIGNLSFSFDSCMYRVEKFPNGNEKGEVSLILCESNEPNFKIPSWVEFETKQYKVVSIHSKAFVRSSGQIAKITIPPTIREIEDGAFIGTNVKFFSEGNAILDVASGYIASKESKSLIALSPSQNFPDSALITSVSPFSVCGYLKERITIPSHINKIEEGSFVCCSNLNRFNVCDNNLFMVDNDCLVEKGTRTLLSYPMGKEDSKFIVSNNISRIGNYAFSGAKYLKSIQIPSNVKSIGESVFFRCANLSEILVEKDNAQYRSLDGILYSSDLSKIISVPPQFEFSSIDGIKTFIVPSSVRFICKHAFLDNKSIENLVIQGELTIDAEAFAGCEKLKNVFVVDSDFVEFEENSFGEEVNILTNSKSLYHQIEKSPLGNLFKSIKMVENFKNRQISKFQYNECEYQLSSYGTVDLIATCSTSYSSCYAMDSVVFWKGQVFHVKSIKNKLFKGAAFDELILPQYLTSIGESVFCQCKQLRKIKIGKSLLEIGAGSFEGCEKLSEIYTMSKPFNVVKSKNIFKLFHSKEQSVFPENIKVYVPYRMYQEFQDNSVRNGWGANVEGYVDCNE